MDKETEHTQPDETELEAEEFEPTDEEGAETVGKDKLKQLREKLQACEQEKRTLNEELQRSKADYLNSRKRLEEDKQAAIARSEDHFVTSLLPLADSFAMAMKDTAAWEAIDEAWRTGVEGIHQKLQRILTAHGVQEINPLNEPFDPNRHEAVGTSDATGEADTVAEVVQIGYERNDAILRPAKVIIRA